MHRAHQLNLADAESTRALLGGCQAVLSALPFFCNVAVAEHAAAVGCNYLDLTEDVATTQAVEAVAKKAAVWMMPQCLGTRFTSIAAHHVVKSFDSLESVKMRVGALPVYPSNRLKYNMTWSTEGLINEYGNMCEAIEGDKQARALFARGL